MNNLTTSFDAFKQSIPGSLDSLTEGEIYFWAQEKRAENLHHIQLGHSLNYGMCRICGNCQCGDKRFRCICSSGKTFITPYKVRSRFGAPKESEP